MGITNKSLLLELYKIIGQKKCYLYFAIAICTAILDLAGIALIYPYISIILNPDYLEKISFLKNKSHQEATIFISASLFLFYILKAYLQGILFHEQNKISS